MRQIISALAMLIILGSNAVLATPVHKFSFNQKYGTEGTALDSCTTCHTSAPSFNPYGSDLSALGSQTPIADRLAAIENEDSDDDTVNNLQEITVDGTFPGDPSSVPAAATAWGDIKALFR